MRVLFCISKAHTHKLASLLLLLILSSRVVASDNTNSVLNLIGSDDDVSEYWIRVYVAPPVYPRRAQEQYIGGYADFSFTISSLGMPEDIVLIETDPSRMFVETAKHALSQYRWREAEFNVQKRPVRTSIRIRFEMENSSPQRNFYYDRVPIFKRTRPTDRIIRWSTDMKKRPPRKIKECSPQTNSRLLKTCEYE